jgi:hypothetical protein
MKSVREERDDSELWASKGQWPLLPSLFSSCSFSEDRKLLCQLTWNWRYQRAWDCGTWWLCNSEHHCSLLYTFLHGLGF